MPLNNIVSGMIQRGGGSVVVSAAGAVSATSVGDIILGGSTGGILKGGASNAVVWNAAGGVTVAGTLTVSGTGTHQFSGPILASAAIQSNRALGNYFFYLSDSGASAAKRAAISLAGTTADMVAYAATGAAGSETYTESLRIVNANGYVSVATRLGIKTASPSYDLDIAGTANISTALGVGTVPDTTKANAVIAATAQSRAALQLSHVSGATAPVLVVKGGATPGAGGDLAQFQNAAGGSLVIINGAGWLVLNAGVAQLSQPTGAPGAPVAGQARLWYDDTAKAFKYIDSAGTTRTITAA